MPINCLVVDDDEMALSHLCDFVNQTPFLNLISHFNHPTAALNALENEELQLVFLDINMPALSGIELARIINSKSVDNSPRIIFTSGYERYALEGYKVKAIDYLLKPVEYNDFINAAYKAKSLIEHGHNNKALSKVDYTDNDFIFLRVEYELIKIYLKNILYIEGFKDYVKIYATNVDGYIKSLTTMKKIEEKLPIHSFIRIHRSFIVSLDKIDSITTTTVKIGKSMIPVSSQYKEDFKKFIDHWF
ncbi:LytR/AlgR family response regulator transcription factor [Mucilaginibacter sp. OK098]|uniref:LytR/AlgR family response regulator transcription factor n=1 Tax=Mucilaginibacter sp. OK098 TaxID=1855297 RepID=UPI00091E5A4B|nr:LytTR family DNA-binding domain-containing protein [Mucilaginibacter sp. OK098]SHN14190.1 two component transcriptional regulator, LytTR family [Mucilaginibacter sp. OK098]